ncbi:MAG: AMP-binding protein [Actinomycetota bacterium]
MTTPLTAGPVGTGPDAVATLYAALRRAVDDGAGPGLLMAADPSAAARVTQPLDGVDVVIATSGSTDGRGHLVGLSLDALVASATATHQRLGGPGQWLTSLPVHHVAGFQAVLRSVLAGIPPVVHHSGHLAASVAELRDDVPRYLSLVPTQLVRALTDPGLLARFDAVLVGGAALAPDVAARAREAGVRVVASYGMTETAGGCVYDGVPLAGARVRLVDGRVQLAGPMLATRYVDAPDQPFIYDDGERWLATADLGEWADGRLRVLGRSDDVIVSGGINVAPRVVEEALARLGGTWVVVPVPDAKWGQLVVAVGSLEHSLADVRAATAHLAPAERPRAVVRGEAILLGPGKVNRRATAAFAMRELTAGRGERKS